MSLLVPRVVVRWQCHQELNLTSSQLQNQQQTEDFIMYGEFSVSQVQLALQF